jgi:transcriptional regulator with XRE-family HTH domain
MIGLKKIIQEKYWIDMTGRNIEAYDVIIGKNIRHIRKDRGYTLEEISDLLGVSQQQLSKNEKGRNRLSAVNLYKLARYFEVNMEAFFNIRR